MIIRQVFKPCTLSKDSTTISSIRRDGFDLAGDDVMTTVRTLERLHPSLFDDGSSVIVVMPFLWVVCIRNCFLRRQESDCFAGYETTIIYKRNQTTQQRRGTEEWWWFFVEALRLYQCVIKSVLCSAARVLHRAYQVSVHHSLPQIRMAVKIVTNDIWK